MRHDLPPLDSLWVFHVVAEVGSLTAAAAVMNVTQPAISKRLRDLEAVLGTALVLRGANTISLTAAGYRFAADIRRGFEQLQLATRQLQAQTAPLRIRAYTTWALRWLIPRLPAFQARHPGIEVEVSTSTASVDLVRDGVDAAISTARRDRPPAPTTRRLQPVIVAPFATPVLAATWHSGQPQRLLGSKVRPDDWSHWQEASGLPPQGTPLLFESTSLAIQAALEGLGVVICSTAFVQGEVEAGRLAALSDHPLATGDCYWLTVPQGRLSDKLNLFADWLAQEAALEPLPAAPHRAGAGAALRGRSSTA